MAGPLAFVGGRILTMDPWRATPEIVVVERGSITPGKRADLVVLEGDLDAEHPPRVVETWIGGEHVYAAP